MWIPLMVLIMCQTVCAFSQTQWSLLFCPCFLAPHILKGPVWITAWLWFAASSLVNHVSRQDISQPPEELSSNIIWKETCFVLIQSSNVSTLHKYEYSTKTSKIGSLTNLSWENKNNASQYSNKTQPLKEQIFRTKFHIFVRPVIPDVYRWALLYSVDDFGMGKIR